MVPYITKILQNILLTLVSSNILITPAFTISQ